MLLVLNGDYTFTLSSSQEWPDFMGDDWNYSESMSGTYRMEEGMPMLTAEGDDEEWEFEDFHLFIKDGIIIDYSSVSVLGEWIWTSVTDIMGIAFGEDGIAVLSIYGGQIWYLPYTIAAPGEYRIIFANDYVIFDVRLIDDRLVFVYYGEEGGSYIRKDSIDFTALPIFGAWTWARDDLSVPFSPFSEIIFGENATARLTVEGDEQLRPYAVLPCGEYIIIMDFYGDTLSLLLDGDMLVISWVDWADERLTFNFVRSGSADIDYSLLPVYGRWVAEESDSEPSGVIEIVFGDNGAARVVVMDSWGEWVIHFLYIAIDDEYIMGAGYTVWNVTLVDDMLVIYWGETGGTFSLVRP
jgi:hypothetical protein